MGTYQSKYEVIDWTPNRNISGEHRINEWHELPLKNSEYYDGTRFCKIPRHLYPSYSKGLIWGYYAEDADYWKDIYNESV